MAPSSHEAPLLHLLLLALLTSSSLALPQTTTTTTTTTTPKFTLPSGFPSLGATGSSSTGGLGALLSGLGGARPKSGGSSAGAGGSSGLFGALKGASGPKSGGSGGLAGLAGLFGGAGPAKGGSGGGSGSLLGGLFGGGGAGAGAGAGGGGGGGGLASMLSGTMGSLLGGGVGGGMFKGMPAAKGAAPVPFPTVECSAVHFVVGRGSGEPQGIGFLQRLVDSVGKQVQGVTAEGIVYPAALDFSNILGYVGSEADGVRAGVKQIEDYVKRCPQSKIVVAGVSQGADVAGSAVCGGGQLLGLTPSISGVSDDVGSHIVAIALFGDPRFVKGQSYNRGNSQNQGIIPHSSSQLRTCAKYASRMLSWCDTGDPFCDSGNQFMAHAGVLTGHFQEALDFVVQQINKSSIPIRG